MPGDYYPAIQPIDLFGLYDAARSRRLQEEHQRAMLEAQSQSDRMTALTHAAELAYKTGDAKWATGLYDASTPLGNAGDYDVIRSAAKSGKAKLATPSAGGQTQLAQGIGANIAGAPDALQGALAQFRGEEQGTLSGVPQDVMSQIGERGRALAALQGQQLNQFTQKQDITRIGQVEAARQTQVNKANDIVFSVRDRTGGSETADTVVGLPALRAARAANPNLIVTGKPTLVGSGEEVFGQPTKTRYAQLQDDAIHLEQAATDITEAIGMIESNPALAGFVGTATRALGGGWQTLQEMSGMPIADKIERFADDQANRIADDVAAGRIDPKVARDLTKALSDPNAAALDVLGASITYGYARSLRGEGKLTVDDKSRAENSVGIRTGAFTSSAQVASRLKYALKRIEHQLVNANHRLDFGKKNQPATGGDVGTLTPLDAPPAGGFDIDLMGAGQ